MIGYPVEMTEYERGWGHRPDGFIIFDSEKRRADYVYEQTKDRFGSAPDYYVSYEMRPPFELQPESESKFKDGKFYVDKLFPVKTMYNV